MSQTGYGTEFVAYLLTYKARRTTDLVFISGPVHSYVCCFIFPCYITINEMSHSTGHFDSNFFDALSSGSLCFNLSYIVAVAGCKSARTFRVGPGSGLSLSKCFRSILGVDTKLFITFRVTIFCFPDTFFVLTTVTSVSEVILNFLQLILFASTATFFCSVFGLVSHSFWEGDSGEETSMLALRRRDQSLTRFLACFRKQWPTNRLIMPVALHQTVSFRPIALSWIVSW